MARIDRFSLILAVILSCFLWIYVHILVGKPETIRVINDIPVTPINYSASAGYFYKFDENSRNVAVKIKGPEDPVNNLGRDEISASVDLSSLNSSKFTEQKVVTLGVTVGKLPRNIKLVGSPKVTLIVAPLKRKDFPVSVSFITQPAPGTIVGQYIIKPSIVTVTGNSEDVDKVTHVIVRVDNQPLTADQDFIPIPVDAEGKPVDNVNVSQPTVMVHMASPSGGEANPAKLPPPATN